MNRAKELFGRGKTPAVAQVQGTVHLGGSDGVVFNTPLAINIKDDGDIQAVVGEVPGKTSYFLFDPYNGNAKHSETI